MGIGYSEFLDMTWREFDYLSTGYERRLQRNWDYTRHIIASNYNSSGFAKKTVKANEIMKLPMIDIRPATKIRRLDNKSIESMLSVLKR